MFSKLELNAPAYEIVNTDSYIRTKEQGPSACPPSSDSADPTRPSLFSKNISMPAGEESLSAGHSYETASLHNLGIRPKQVNNSNLLACMQNMVTGIVTHNNRQQQEGQEPVKQWQEDQQQKKHDQDDHQQSPEEAEKR